MKKFLVLATAMLVLAAGVFSADAGKK